MFDASSFRYRGAVKGLANMNSREAVSASKLENINYVHQVMFARATDSLLVYRPVVEILDDPDISREMNMAIDRGVRLEVISEKNLDDTLSFKVHRRNAGKKPINYHRADKELAGLGMRFLVVDEKCFWYMPENGKGLAYFDSPMLAQKLAQTFGCLVRRIE